MGGLMGGSKQMVVLRMVRNDEGRLFVMLPLC